MSRKRSDAPKYDLETAIRNAQNAMSDMLKEERIRVANWVRTEPEKLVECDGHRHADGKPCLVLAPMTLAEIADAIERGDFGEKP